VSIGEVDILCRVRETATLCMALATKMEYYREMAVKVTGSWNDMPHATDNTGKQERYVIQLVDIQRMFAKELDELTKLQKQAREIINRIDVPEQRAVLELYYMMGGLKWEDVASMLKTSLRHVYRLRDEALKKAGG